MFDNIVFHKVNIQIESEEVYMDKKYGESFKNIIPMAASDAQFMINGTCNYLLFPMPAEELRKNILYVQCYVHGSYSPGSFTHRKNMNSYLLMYTYYGSAVLEYQGNQYCLNPGDACIIDCRLNHKYHPIEGTWVHGDLHFCRDSSAPIITSLFTLDSPVFHIKNFNRFQQQLETLLRAASSSASFRDFQINVELQKLLLITAREAVASSDALPIPEHYLRLRTYLESNFNVSLSLDDMSAFSSISKYHLSREFKRYFGQSPKEFIILLRIRHAEMLLESSDLPAYKIGQFVGFSNEANFIRIFKEKNHMTPGDYRKQCL